MPHVRPEPIAPENSGSPSSLGGKPAPMPELKHVDPPQSSVDDNMSIGTADKPRAMPDVQFDDGASDNLRNALNSAADTIETQQGGRDGLFDTARDKFEGKYAHDFHMCHVQLANNSANVVAMLRYGAKLVDYIKECAHVENENRKKAREWENRNGLQQTWDGVVLNKHRPDYAPNPSKPAEPGSAPQRDVNAGAPDASGGTSSAIPENLDGYNTACVSYDNEAGLKHTDITNALTHTQVRAITGRSISAKQSTAWRGGFNRATRSIPGFLELPRILGMLGLAPVTSKPSRMRIWISVCRSVELVLLRFRKSRFIPLRSRAKSLLPASQMIR
ncbi:hypothetical protein [Rothia sp. HMSC065D02]|jgi:hypothetical protein|uniref:hypothetical protein n=1 Tax=Rothia sp. HMSC065D02 TaxID=1739518 RepID=UPI001FEF48B4|nr:hypothetical protein [Rothia sp. HMSC065D02]